MNRTDNAEQDQQARDIEAAGELVEQLSFHWTVQARPRLTGLSDAEYLWEPVPGMWSVRRREDARGPAVGAAHVIEFAYPPPEPTPVTTIAWRLCHVLVGVYGERSARYFGGPAISHQELDHPMTADDALSRLDAAHASWLAGVSALSPARLAERCREHGHEELSMAALVLHINREVIHHLAEVALLRDLYRACGGGSMRE